jgi:hypothetical protein
MMRFITGRVKRTSRLLRENPGKTQVKTARPGLQNFYNDVAACAERIILAGRVPTPEIICDELNILNKEIISKYLALWRAGQMRRHIANQDSELKNARAKDLGWGAAASEGEREYKQNSSNISKEQRLQKVSENTNKTARTYLKSSGPLNPRICTWTLLKQRPKWRNRPNSSPGWNTK